jgi:hypothetical protein
MLKKLNFFPHYKTLLEKGLKNTSIRLGINNRFEENNIVSITVGWSEDNSEEVGFAKITSVAHKKIKDLSDDDLEGESPDCSNKVAVKYVLSAIYHKVVTEEDNITVIKWEKIEKEKG